MIQQRGQQGSVYAAAPIRPIRWMKAASLGVAILLLRTAAPDAVWAFPVEAAEAPTTTLSLTVGAIKSAKKSVLLNIYEFSSVDIAEALLDRIRAGVRVEILQEGQPVGGMSAAARGIQAQIAQAMRHAGSGNRLFEMTSRALDEEGERARKATKRRFRFDHAKYAVIDGKSLLIGSENYSPTGHPREKTKGNRGWEVLVHEPRIAAEYTRIFRGDTDLEAGDLIEVTAEEEELRALKPSYDWLWSPPLMADAEFEYEIALPLFLEDGLAAPAPFSASARPVLLDASEARRITSPDNSLPALLDLVNSAQETLDVQQMTFDSEWGKGQKSPLLQAVIAAARRGVSVRVLLNDERVFGGHNNTAPSKNLPTIRALNRLAKKEDLDLEARTADIKRMGITYIHNKGVLVDGDKTLVSSINWGRNAVLNNREAAVLLTSPEINRHYKGLFDDDWERSEKRLAPSAQGPMSSVCPDRLRITVAIGELALADPDDAAFEAIAHTVFAGEFVRSAGAHTCTLISPPEGARSADSRFIQIRKRPDGMRRASLEGYTPEGMIYSVRATWAGDGPYDGSYTADVYDGSGPSRQRLGPATMSVETLEER
jgi:phosphatidylserine/phosphatidylglycerophosphate/cardiolipin synthase-like enzyme